MKKSSYILLLALVAALLLCSVAVEAKPGKRSGAAPSPAAPSTAAGASAPAGTSGRGGRTGGSVGGGAGAGTPPSADLIKVKPVNAPRDALSAISFKPSRARDASSLNWKAPRRSHKLRQLSPKASLQARTTTESKAGPRKAHAAGRRSVAAKSGAIPRPSGNKGKFNPRSKNRLVFGRGPSVLPAKTAAAAGAAAGKNANATPAAPAAAGADAAGKSGRKSRAGAATAPGGASADAAPAAGSRKGRKSGRSFVEIQTAAAAEAEIQMDVAADGDAADADVKLVKPVIEVGTVGLPEPAAPANKETARPCPKATALVEVESALDAEVDAEVAAEIESAVDAAVDAETESESSTLGELMVETQLESETAAEAEAGSEAVADLQAEVEAAIGSEASTEAAAAGDLTLPSGTVVTAAQLNQIRAAFAKQPTERVFYHWAGYQQSIRWGRNRKIDAGEIGWMNQQMDGMAAGGGFYLAQDPVSSRPYGYVPCYIRTPANANVMDNDQKPIVAVLNRALNAADKVALGQVIPFLHFYNSQNGWWVTHHVDYLSNIRCGNAIITPDPAGPSPIPNPTVNVDGYIDIRKNGVPAGARFVSVHFDGFNNQVTKMPQIATQFDAHVFLETMINENWDPENAALGQDVKNAASWVRSFFVLMQYIDGLSLVRAKKVAPSDPWSVFEPQNFGNFLNTFNSYIQKKMNNQGWGIAAKGTFGDGTGAAVWAKKMVEVTMPQIYAELSGGGEMKYRSENVRAGGPVKQDRNNLWTTGYFVATAGQVQVMQANPYLSVEASQDPSLGDANLDLTAYYYPSPIHLSGITNRVSQPLQDRIKAAANYTGADGPAAFAKDTPALMYDLLINMFTGMYGKPSCSSASDFAGALKAALDLVSIHPCSDFNGRSTRFFMYLAALEGCAAIPVSFMSDLDIVTQFNAYNTFMVNANNGYLQLKVAMMSELISALSNNVIARQYDLPEWGTFMTMAMAQFGNKNFPIELTDDENEMVRTRQFVPLLDRWFGKNWPTRNSP